MRHRWRKRLIRRNTLRGESNVAIAVAGVGEPAPVALSAPCGRVFRPGDGLSDLRPAGASRLPEARRIGRLGPRGGGIWMPGFMQFITGIYLFAALVLFGTIKTPALYMAALAFTAYGVHWFALGWNRLRRADTRIPLGMSV